MSILLEKNVVVAIITRMKYFFFWTNKYDLKFDPINKQEYKRERRKWEIN